MTLFSKKSYRRLHLPVYGASWEDVNKNIMKTVYGIVDNEAKLELREKRETLWGLLDDVDNAVFDFDYSAQFEIGGYQPLIHSKRILTSKELSETNITGVNLENRFPFSCVIKTTLSDLEKKEIIDSNLHGYHFHRVKRVKF